MGIIRCAAGKYLLFYFVLVVSYLFLKQYSWEFSFGFGKKHVTLQC